MRNFLKKIFYSLPVTFQRIILRGYENIHAGKLIKDSRTKNKKLRILFYHISGLSFGGTEKSLQIIAKHLDKEKYDVYFMYSPKARGLGGGRSDGRKPYLENSGINFVEFKYETLESKYPYKVRAMNPSVFDIIKEKNIDFFFTAGSGYAEFPFNSVRNIPIIIINIFGSPNTQKNVLKNICISNEVANKIRPLVAEEKIEVIPILSEGPLDDSQKKGRELRLRLGLKDNDMVFGRIGRADNGIFDSIGIRAFQKVVKEYPDAHYLIMSPPPILEKIVLEEKIPNVHFLPPSSDEGDVWAFHAAIDALAHFRNDGESFGLNIAEAMLSGKPVITHRSHIWNAHLEYLESTFSRVAKIGDIDQYSLFMEEFIRMKKENTLENLGLLAKDKANSLFLIGPNIVKFEKNIDKIIL